jgi:Ni/Co efflux regulator RcnB
MKHGRFLTLVLGAASIAGVPMIAAAAPQQRDADRAAEKSGSPQYHFRQADTEKLRQNYKNAGQVDMDHRNMYRERYVVGGHLPDDWRKNIHPVPANLIRELPPIPAGCAIGYIDGYCVVYSIATLEIVEVVDLSS